MTMSVLPYWDMNVDIDMTPWVPYGKDYNPVSCTAICGTPLRDIAGLALDLDSEFLFMNSLTEGAIGAMSRGNIIDPGHDGFGFGFVMVFAYSVAMEQIMAFLAMRNEGIMAGITLCDVWDGDVLVDEFKAVMLVAADPMFNESKLLDEMLVLFRFVIGRLHSGVSFFAEKFGYKRAVISYETDDITQLNITQLLYDMELDATKEVLGPSPEIEVPKPLPELQKLIKYAEPR